MPTIGRVLPVLLVVAAHMSVVTSEFLCPNQESILPCTCIATTRYIWCSGPEVTQSSIDHTFSSLRAINNVPLPGILNINDLGIHSTKMTTIDLTPILWTNITNRFNILYNSGLGRVHGPILSSFLKQSDCGFTGQIEADNLHILRNPNLSDEGLTDFFVHFSPSRLTEIVFSGNGIRGSHSKIQDGSGDVEFLPGLSLLKNLRVLQLQENPLECLSGGQFKRNFNLQNLKFTADGSLYIGPDAFLIDLAQSNHTNRRFISATYGNFTDDNFHVHSGLEFWNYLILYDNKFEYITSENFEPFLMANPSNVMNFKGSDGTPFVCDARMKWLKDGREEFEHRVLHVDCTNDPGKTIFTTDLV